MPHDTLFTGICDDRATLPAPYPPTRMPHVLQIGMLWGQDGTAGGVDRIYTDFVRHLPEQGFAVTGAVHGPENVQMLSEGQVHSFARPDASKAQRYFGARRVIGEILRTQKIDLVAAHFALYTVLALDRLADHPLVAHFHGPWFAESAQEGAGGLSVWTKRWIERRVYRRADRVVVLSRAFADLVTREFGVAEDRVRVVPGHVDLDRFAPTGTRVEARTALGWPKDRLVLLSVRRLRHRMGLDRLIAAMRSVVVAVPDVLLLIGGTGPIRSALERQVSEAGLERHIQFLGFVQEEHLPLAYRAADLNVVPTLALEGFGLVIAEALAAGTPSIVTPVGGLPEVVAPLCAELVLPSNSVPDLADGLIAALRGELRLPDDVACRAYACENFALATATRRVAGIYREILC
jgi:glycosyltransferase involved in cell wall biosynthesis